jgi:hypothetical protein
MIEIYGSYWRKKEEEKKKKQEKNRRKRMSHEIGTTGMH